MPDEFKHDVAISLLDRDLALAEELGTVFHEDTAVFLYSEQQKELAGEDGMVRFTDVFRRDSRVVVVLARKDWGGTKWTRIEETAIKNRGFDEGWAFLVMVPLDGRGSVPDWVPTTRIWADVERLGAKGLAAVVERKVEDRGKVVRRESVADLHARIERERRLEAERQTFLGSHEGVRVADQEYGVLCSHLEEGAPSIGITVSRDSSGGCALTKDRVSLSLSWHRTYRNTLNESRLMVKLWDGILSDHVSMHFRAKRPISELIMQLDRVADTPGWRAQAKGARFWPTVELGNHCLEALLRWANGERVVL